MTGQEATNQQEWDAFLCAQRFSPFLQSWTMGEVYRDTGQEPIRLEIREGNELIGICQCIIVPARRGKHVTVPYGPVVSNFELRTSDFETKLISVLKDIAQAHNCSFIRISPFWPVSTPPILGTKSSTLHLLAEHIWYLPLTEPNPWKQQTRQADQRMTPRSQEEILQEMRQNTRNLIRRAERDGVAVMASDDPVRDLSIFIDLHEETRRRHHFTPYTNEFFRSQVKRFSERHECTLYLAKYQGEIIATSIHMHMGGETSYHHGAS
ncbi:MAG: peptidoglycan bridge formation glycyltransferase FemA/FemB family protein, partial [Candidatus Peribacteraceae bacterium]|nr:peptidoglycan bridge formation glycyltransferase FemA/FemB family protein [Candidatus Peribacteraceae bacterium]